MQEDVKLRRAFETGLRLPQDFEVETLEFSKSEYWDSISHMRLIAAIEEEFNIRLEVQDVIGMSSFLVAKDILKKYSTPLSQ